MWASPEDALFLFLLANAIPYLDLLDMVVRLFARRYNGARAFPWMVDAEQSEFTPYQMKCHLRPYAVVVSVFNVAGELDEFIERMRAYQDRLWIIDDGSEDNTFAYLKALGVRCLRSPVNRKKPAAIRELVASLPPEVETVLVLDPDVWIRNGSDSELPDLERVIFDFQQSRAAALCPKVEVSGIGLLTWLQAFEYEAAFALGRQSLADHCVTSGVAIYRRSALEKLLDKHSLSVYAEDLENAFILLAQREKIYYDDRLRILAECPRTWTRWFSQRVGWSYGLLKVYAERGASLWRSGDRRPAFVYQFFIYTGLVGLLLHPLRLASVGLLAASALNAVDGLLGADWIPDSRFARPIFFLAAYIQYTLVTALCLGVGLPPGRRARYLALVPLYFLYAVAQVVPASVGYFNWLSLRLLGRRVYRDHYAAEPIR